MHAAITGLFLAALTTTVCADDTPTGTNLIVNGGFDGGLSGWQVLYERPATWWPMDANGDSTSGSAFLRNAYVGNGATSAILMQCIPVKGGETVYASGDVLLPEHMDPEGHRASILVWSHFGENCFADGQPVAYPTLYEQGPDWQFIEGSGVVPPGADFISVMLGVGKSHDVTEIGDAYFDNIFVSIENTNAIFADGFEP